MYVFSSINKNLVQMKPDSRWSFSPLSFNALPVFMRECAGKMKQKASNEILIITIQSYMCALPNHKIINFILQIDRFLCIFDAIFCNLFRCAKNSRKLKSVEQITRDKLANTISIWLIFANAGHGKVALVSVRVCACACVSVHYQTVEISRNWRFYVVQGNFGGQYLMLIIMMTMIIIYLFCCCFNY